MDAHDTIARRIYEANPAVTPFSRKPMSLDLARALGTRSAARADIAAAREIEAQV